MAHPLYLKTPNVTFLHLDELFGTAIPIDIICLVLPGHEYSQGLALLGAGLLSLQAGMGIGMGAGMG